MNERQADIRTGFAHLRNLCDPRGHDLLRVMEDLLLLDAERPDLPRLPDLEPVLSGNGHRSRRVDLWRADA